MIETTRTLKLDEVVWPSRSAGLKGSARGAPGNRGVTARALASILKPYGIISSRTPTARVYLQGDLQDAWTRYLSDEPSQVSEASSG